MSPATYEVDGEVHLLDRLAIVYRYRAIAISVFILTTMAIVIQSYTAVSMYVAQARLLIEDERSTAIPGINPNDAYYQDPEPYYNTQYRILKGRDLVRKVVKTLKLDTVPEFNGTAPKPDTPPAHHPRRPGAPPDRHVQRPEGRRGRRGAAPDRRNAGRIRAGRRLCVTDRRRTDPRQPARRRHVSVDRSEVRGARANALVHEYVDQNLEVKTQGTQNMLEWLDRELGNQQKKVQESEAALANYREKQNAMSLDDKQNIVVSRLNKLADDVVVAKTKKARAQVLWDQLRSATPSQMAEIVTIAQSPPVSAAKAKVAGRAARARAARRSLRREASRAPEGERRAQRIAAPVRPRGARARLAGHQERVRHPPSSKSRRSPRT